MKVRTILIPVLLFLFITGCRPTSSPAIPSPQPSAPVNPTSAETGTTPSRDTSEPELSPEDVLRFIPQGEVHQERIELDSLGEELHQRLVNAVHEAGPGMEDAWFRVISRSDETGKEWHNILVGEQTGEEKGTNRQSWLYAEVNEAETQYVLPGEGMEGRLIPTGVSYVVGEEKVGLGQLGEGQRPEAVLFSLGYGEGDNFQGVREFIYFDLQEGEVYCTDPWTGGRYQLEDALDRVLLARIMPIESQLFPGLPAEKAREALNQGWLPDLDEEDGWIAKDSEGEVVKEWSEESSEWVDTLGEWERGFKEQWEHDIEVVNQNINEFLSMPDEQLTAYIRKYQMKNPYGLGDVRDYGPDGTQWFSRSGDVLGVYEINLAPGLPLYFVDGVNLGSFELMSAEEEDPRVYGVVVYGLRLSGSKRVFVAGWLGSKADGATDEYYVPNAIGSYVLEANARKSRSYSPLSSSAMNYDVNMERVREYVGQVGVAMFFIPESSDTSWVLEINKLYRQTVYSQRIKSLQKERLEKLAGYVKGEVGEGEIEETRVEGLLDSYKAPLEDIMESVIPHGVLFVEGDESLFE